MRVLDVSKHQLSYDPAIASSRGIDATIVRIAYGFSPDSLAISWVNRILASGQKVGCYGFGTWHYRRLNGGSVIRARELMQNQVAVWIKEAKRCGINWWFAIDQELEKNESMGLSMADNTNLINEAASMIKNAGFTPLLYCSVAWDYVYVHTASLDPDIKYWMADYGVSTGTVIKDKDFPSVKMDMLPVGKYTNWLKKCYETERLAGWQYGSTAWGATYGVGSADLDRSIFWFDPQQSKPARILFEVHTGPMTKGDLEAVEVLLKDRLIGYEVSEHADNT